MLGVRTRGMKLESLALNVPLSGLAGRLLYAVGHPTAGQAATCWLVGGLLRLAAVVHCGLAGNLGRTADIRPDDAECGDRDNQLIWLEEGERG